VSTPVANPHSRNVALGVAFGRFLLLLHDGPHDSVFLLLLMMLVEAAVAFGVSLPK
jgi:hypothetical protein